MKNFISSHSLALAIMLSSFFGCAPAKKEAEKQSPEVEKQAISNMLDQFNLAAAKADYQSYFDFYTEDGTFSGTDATENWDKKDFKIWARPYFDKKKTWNFTSLERHIFFDKTGELAWFDELLKTQMKICRGSGVVVKQGNAWKVQQYVLSMTIPNSLSDSVINLKAPVENALIQTLENK